MQVDLVFLLKAVKEKRSMDVFYKEVDRTWNYSSRFLNLVSEDHTIIIDLPQMKDETYKALKVGYIIYLAFSLAGFRFQFRTKVKEKITYKVAEGKEIPALKIVWPDQILNGNRRSLFRVQVEIDESIEVKYQILDEGKEDAHKGDSDEYEGVEALMMDISEVGLAVRINRPVNVKMGDRLKLRFRLGERENEIEMEGMVRHIRKYEGSSVHLCGIEFISTDTLENKRSMRKIALYTMSKKQENVNFFSINTIVSKNPVARKIVDGEATDELLKMLFAREIKLSIHEYLESMVYVLKIEKFKKRALSYLKSIPIHMKVKYIRRMDANHRVAYYILSEALSGQHLEIISAVINNQYLPVEFWKKIAKEGNARMLRILMANKNKLIACPEIMDEMEKNPSIMGSILKSIQEIRESYLVGVTPELISEEDVIEIVTEELKKEKAEEIGEVDLSEVEGEAQTSLQKINQMSVRERVQLAFSGNKSERLILAKDPNKFVGLSLIESPQIGKDEIYEILQNKSISGEVVRKISENRNWIRNYSVMLSLIKHPKVPVKKASTYVKRVKHVDLRKMAKDREINPAIRAIVASKLQKKD